MAFALRCISASLYKPVREIRRWLYTRSFLFNVDSRYDVLYKKSLKHPEEFWDEIAQNVEWMKPYEQVMDNSNPPFTKWFVGGKLNSSYNALDRNVSQGSGDKVALIYDSPFTGVKLKITYSALKDRVARLAGALASLGLQMGDMVLIYLPTIPEAVVGMYAAARLGAIHNVVYGGFAAPELSVRIKHSKPKVILSTSVGYEPSGVVNYKSILDEAISLSSHEPKHCLIFQRDFSRPTMKPVRDIDWNDIEEKSQPHDPVPVDSNHPAYILYTSGTTGDPKGVVRSTGGNTVVLPWTMKTIFDISVNDVWWACSDFGWVVSHSYICYGPLLNGSTTVVYEGRAVGTQDPYQYFRIINEYGVKCMFATPNVLKTIYKELPPLESNVRRSRLSSIFTAGEALDKFTRDWAEKAFGSHVLDHYWQTEVGFPISAHCLGLGMTPAPFSCAGKPFMGYDVRVLTEEGKEASPGVRGRIVCKLPLPPGTFSSLYRADDRFKQIYFSRYKGYYDTMDAGTISADGYLSVQSRDDDVIKVSDLRLSTLALEEAMLSHEDVIEVAVFSVSDPVRSEVPLGLFVVRNQCQNDEETITKELTSIVHRQVGAVASFHLCAQVPALPKTRSGKIPRKSFADLARDKCIDIPPTIEDPSLYEGVVVALKKCGYAKNISYPFKHTTQNLFV